MKYVDTSAFRSPYRHAVLQGLGELGRFGGRGGGGRFAGRGFWGRRFGAPFWGGGGWGGWGYPYAQYPILLESVASRYCAPCEGRKICGTDEYDWQRECERLRARTAASGLGVLGGSTLGDDAQTTAAACTFAFNGAQTEAISRLQQGLNVWLDTNGYLPIPVTGIWDAATCGALEAATGGDVSSPAVSAMVAGWSGPACSAITLGDCVQKVPPTKKASGAPPPSGGTQQQSMLPVVLGVAGVGVLLAIAVAVSSKGKATT